MNPYITFADLTKAFDTVSRQVLWKIMAKFGYPAKFIALYGCSTMVCLQGSKMVFFLSIPCDKWS